MDRNEFRHILESISVPEDTTSDEMREIMNPITCALRQMAPDRLYKYRSCTDNHISAFENDKIWLSTSDLFNDPFDTLIQYNEDTVRTGFNFGETPEMLEVMAKYLAEGGQIPESIVHIIGERGVDRLREMSHDIVDGGNSVIFPSNNQVVAFKDMINIYLRLLPLVAQRFFMVACFSERIDSILMWSHYSCNHTGFALGYDLIPFLNPNELNLGLFPIVYGDVKYNAERYLLYMLGHLNKLPVKNPDVMSPIKLLLYKSLDWEYEQEWRLIRRGISYFRGCAESIMIKPNSIYYGCRISSEDYQRLHEIAIRKGLEEYQVSIDNSSYRYAMRVNPKV